MNHNMAFASPSSTIPKSVIAIQSNSYCNLGPEPGQQKSPTLTRHAGHAEQHDDNAHPLPSPQSSSQTVYGITAAGTNLSLGSPSSWSIPNVSHPSPSLNDVKNSEPHPSCALSSSPVEPQSQRPNSSPLTDNNFITSVTPQNDISTSHPKNHVFLFSSIRDLKRLNPTFVLQNCGSVARDHLSSERTFLAYVHTSLALASAGVGVVQLFTIVDLIIPSSSEISMMEASRKLQRFAMPLGALSQVLALYILLLGEWFTLLFFFSARLRQR
jgi:uncharacterized membrane protein YidH (DUF202 family)